MKYIKITTVIVLLLCCLSSAANSSTDDSTALRQALTKFLQSVDSGKMETVIAFYDTGFTSIRVVDQGPLIKMDRQQMIYFWKMIAAKKPADTAGFNYKAIIVQQTTIHFSEIIDGTGYVLMTRIKDLGHGPEPMFYNLIWKKHGGNWYLFREIVHQRTLPAR